MELCGLRLLHLVQRMPLDEFAVRALIHVVANIFGAFGKRGPVAANFQRIQNVFDLWLLEMNFGRSRIDYHYECEACGRTRVSE